MAKGLPEHFEIPPGADPRLSDPAFLRDCSGKRSSHMFLDLPLELGPPMSLRRTLADATHLDDWLNRKEWPEHLVPLAVYSPETDEDEEVVIEASPSETEQFLAVDVRPPHAVHLWSHDAGFEKLTDDLDAFLTTLE